MFTLIDSKDFLSTLILLPVLAFPLALGLIYDRFTAVVALVTLLLFIVWLYVCETLLKRSENSHKAILPPTFVHAQLLREKWLKMFENYSFEEVVQTNSEGHKYVQSFYLNKMKSFEYTVMVLPMNCGKSTLAREAAGSAFILCVDDIKLSDKVLSLRKSAHRSGNYDSYNRLYYREVIDGVRQWTAKLAFDGTKTVVLVHGLELALMLEPKAILIVKIHYLEWLKSVKHRYDGPLVEVAKRNWLETSTSTVVGYSDLQSNVAALATRG